MRPSISAGVTSLGDDAVIFIEERISIPPEIYRIGWSCSPHRFSMSRRDGIPRFHTTKKGSCPSPWETETATRQLLPLRLPPKAHHTKREMDAVTRLLRSRWNGIQRCQMEQERRRVPARLLYILFQPLQTDTGIFMGIEGWLHIQGKFQEEQLAADGLKPFERLWILYPLIHPEDVVSPIDEVIHVPHAMILGRKTQFCKLGMDATRALTDTSPNRRRLSLPRFCLPEPSVILAGRLVRFRGGCEFVGEILLMFLYGLFVHDRHRTMGVGYILYARLPPVQVPPHSPFTKPKERRMVPRFLCITNDDSVYNSCIEKAQRRRTVALNSSSFYVCERALLPCSALSSLSWRFPSLPYDRKQPRASSIGSRGG